MVNLVHNWIGMFLFLEYVYCFLFHYLVRKLLFLCFLVSLSSANFQEFDPKDKQGSNMYGLVLMTFYSDLLLLLFTAIEFSLGCSSPYTGNKNE